MIQKVRDTVVVVVALITTVLFVASFVVYAQGSPLGLRFLEPAKESMTRVIPQGWGFFTKDSREPSWTVLRVDDGDLVTPKTGAANSLTSFLGVSRNHRVVGLEQIEWLSLLERDQVSAISCSAEVISECFDELEGDIDYVEIDASAQRGPLRNCGHHWIYLNLVKPFSYRDIAYDQEWTIYPVDIECEDAP